MSLEPLAVYIHWPFCLSKCPYCDFNSHVRNTIDIERWCKSFLAELDYFAEMIEGKKVSSIFFGGGTPSLMPPDLVAKLIEHVDIKWGILSDCEITLEANPTSAETKNFKLLAQAGVNRLSVGVQALKDEDLAFLGREHSSKEALSAVDAACKAVDRVSLDLIYARPNQTLKSWEQELLVGLSTGVNHISLYQLTLEKGTKFFSAHRKGEFKLPDDELAVALFMTTRDLCHSKGFPAYEVSNHAKHGQESRHNLAYWRGQNYLGIGPGAHGRIRINGALHSTEQISSPEKWLRAVENQGHATRKMESLPKKVQIEELLMMGLRLTNGLDRRSFRENTGVKLEDAISEEKLTYLQHLELIELDTDGLRATESGLLKLNSVITSLIV